MNFSTNLQALARLPRLAGRGLVTLYRATLSPLIGPRCRHLPSCSEYADEAIDRFGLWAGAWMALARILRCHPWGTSGLDFVPAALPSSPVGTCHGGTGAGVAPTIPHRSSCTARFGCYIDFHAYLHS
jgi:putative membrane protein insertion efficiency factor